GPPRRSVIPDSVSPSHRVSEMSLSACPLLGLPVMNLPPPSMLPAPTKPMFVSRSPQIIASWKWLCPKSWNAEFGLDSGASYPDDEPMRVAPASSISVTLLIMWIEPPARYVPAGNSTVAPPAVALAATIALLTAGVSLAVPSPTAPKLLTFRTVCTAANGCAVPAEAVATTAQ